MFTEEQAAEQKQLGRDQGWNEAIEELRLYRYAAKVGGDMTAVEEITKVLQKLAKKGIS